MNATVTPATPETPATPAWVPPPARVALADDMPDGFTMEELTRHLTPQEMEAGSQGEDAAFAPTPDAAPAPDANAAPIVPDESALPAAEPPPPVPLAPNVAELDTKVTDLEKAMDTLTDKYDMGELTKAEWQAQNRELIKQQSAIEAQKIAAQQQYQRELDARISQWHAAEAAYRTQHPYLANEEHYDGWDATLRQISSSAAYYKLPFIEQIKQAHRVYAAHYEGLTGKPLPTMPGATKAAKAAAELPEGVKPPRTDARDPVTTLGGLAAVAPNDVDGSHFSVIDRTADQDPMAAERALKNMTADDEARYLGLVG